VVFTFYYNFIFPATFISGLSCYLILREGSAVTAIYMFWMKIISGLLLGVFFHLYGSEQLYFFNNLGYSKERLYISTGMMDMMIWLMATIITIQLL
jgi:hypothetical protein